MDKIDKIKQLVKKSLDTSFGDRILVEEIHILPTQKFHEQSNEWIPDSFSIFLSLKDKRTSEEKPDFYHFESDDPKYKVSFLLEKLLGFEVCVDFV